MKNKTLRTNSMKLKRVIAASLAISVLFAFTGCGSSSTTDNTKQESSSTTETGSTDELNEKINAYKGAVSAIKAIKNQYGNEFEDVSKMYYTCYEGEYEYYIDCSYNKFKVTSNKDEEPEYIVPDMPAYTKVCYDNETNLTIVLYEPEYMSNGFLTGLANSIRNDTSDMLFNRTVLSAKEMNLEALQKYLG